MTTLLHRFSGFSLAKKAFFTRTAPVCAIIAAFIVTLTACEQPTRKTSGGNGGTNPQTDTESNELNSETALFWDDKGKTLKDIRLVQTYPPAYEMVGNQDAETLYIQPRVKSTNGTAVVRIDNKLWGTWQESGGQWVWPDPNDSKEEISPLHDEEENSQNSVPFNVNYTITVTTSIPTNAPSEYGVYTYTITAPTKTVQPDGSKQGTRTGRITGNFATSFPGSNYTKTQDANLAKAGKDGWQLKVVQAVDSAGKIVGSTEFTDGKLEGRYFTMPIFGQPGMDTTTLKYRAVFQKGGCAPHYSYPSVPLSKFAGKLADETADTPYKHTIFPQEVMNTDIAAGSAFKDKWLINGADYQVPTDGVIRKIILEAKSDTTGEVRIGVFENADNGRQPILKWSKTVATTAGHNEYDPENNAIPVKAGDKIGVMTTGTSNFARINEQANGMALVCDNANGALAACTNNPSTVTFGAVGVGYIFEPMESKQFEELPVSLAIIPIGGKDYPATSTTTAESILRNIGNNALYPLNGSYMLFEDITLGSAGFCAIGRNNKNGQFFGRFYGNGHTISNIKLEVTNPVTYEMPSIFGWVNGTGNANYGTLVIRDLNLVMNTSETLVLDKNIQSMWGGCLVSDISGPVDISNIHVRGDVPGRPLRIKVIVPTGTRDLYWGAITGSFEGGGSAAAPNRVSRCSSSLDVYIESTNTKLWVGGIAGAGKHWPIVNECYNDGSITALSTTHNNNWLYVGGIMGKQDGNQGTGLGVFNSYSTGKITLITGGLLEEGDANAVEHIISGPGAATVEKVFFDPTNGNSNARIGGITGEPYPDSVLINYSYAAGSLSQRGKLSAVGNCGIGGIAGYNQNTNRSFIHNNVALAPALVCDMEVTNYFRVARSPSDVAKNYAWSGMTIARGSIAATPFSDSVMHGTGKDLAEFKGKGKESTYTALDWKFESNATPNAEDNQTLPGRDWSWKIENGGNYPFPLLWWQANHVTGTNGGDTYTGPDGSQLKYQWWETKYPAIDETWAADGGSATATTLSIPHDFPEAAAAP